MHDDFLQDLAVVMIVAAVVTIIFRVLRQPVVLGYILAGLIVGPHTPGIPLSVHDRHTIDVMSELGVILLMFGLGLHFSLRQLASVGPTAFIAATLEIVVMLTIGYAIGRAFAWSQMDSLFLGAILSISSTTIIIKALGELGLTKERFAELIFGVLIVEDILGIAMIALLSGIATTGTFGAGQVALTLGKLAVFLAAVLVGGLLAVPSLLRFVARFKSNEVLLITSLGLCFGVSLLALRLGYSVALGAFLIGAIIAEVREKGRIELIVEPVRDMFSAVFFVTIGMLIEPGMLIKYALPILVITIAVVVGKVISCGLGTFLAGNDARTSTRVGMGLSQIGEFSFIIASLGLSLNVTSDFLYPIAVTVSAITTLLTPYLIKGSDGVVRIGSRLIPKPIANYLELYSAWVSRFGSADGASHQVRRLVRKWLLQILLNVALVTAVFIVDAALARRMNEWWPGALPRWTGRYEALAWLGGMVVSMPLLIVTYRKLRAIAHLISEATVTKKAAGQNTDAVRAAIAGTIRIAGAFVLVAYLILLTTAIMPPWPVLVVLLILVAVIATLQWRAFEKVYNKAQLSLRETLTQPIPEHGAHPNPLPPVLQDAELETVIITSESPARGKLIRELQLRTKSGASAVGIERGDAAGSANIVNPGPDDELQMGDKVVLLGRKDQLIKARRLLELPVSEADDTM
jgi:CPA2 family monovalent cation:H+ antiporter-2